MEEVEVDTIDEDLADASQVRLSDVELPFKLEAVSYTHLTLPTIYSV